MSEVLFYSEKRDVINEINVIESVSIQYPYQMAEINAAMVGEKYRKSS